MKIQNQLGYIKGITFAPFHKRGSLSTPTARDSFDYMIEHTAADFVILAPAGLQEHAHSEEICYTSSATFSDEELINMIRYAKSKGIRVALKPTVNCKNGAWRAYISFFEKDVLHLGVNAVITEINTENQTITVKDADQNEVLGENCVIACSDIPLFYCHYDTHEIKDISLEDLQVDDSVILGIYNSELEAYKNKTGDNILHIEQLQLGTQRLG